MRNIFMNIDKPSLLILFLSRFLSKCQRDIERSYSLSVAAADHPTHIQTQNSSERHRIRTLMGTGVSLSLSLFDWSCMGCFQSIRQTIDRDAEFSQEEKELKRNNGLQMAKC
jgi:hypothetical protein